MYPPNTQSLQSAAIRYTVNRSCNGEECVLALLEPQLPLICRSILRKEPSPDQLQECRIGALLALRAYNPSKGQYKTLLKYYLKRALYRSHPALIRLPEYQRRAVGRLSKLEEEGPLTDEEIAVLMNLTESQVTDLRSAEATTTNAWYHPERVTDEYGSVDVSLDLRHALRELAKHKPRSAAAAKEFLRKELAGYTK